MMTNQQAQERAAQLGLSVWQREAIKVGSTSEAVTVRCIGFAGLDLVVAEGESWEEAFSATTRIIFAP